VRLRLRRYRVLFGCLVLSLVFHFVVVPLLVGLFGVQRGVNQPLEVVYEAPITTLRMMHRAVTPHHPVQRPRILPQAQRVPPPQPRPQPQVAAAIHPPDLPRPIRRNAVHAPSETIDLARQQAEFQKTITQLREQDNPVAEAERPVQVASEPERFTFNVSQGVGTRPQAEGVLTPVKSWHDGPYDYYYVQYWVQYEDGGTETGYVPWPIRYLPKQDPFLLHLQHFPLPGPMPDFALPADTRVHPLIAFCLEHRDELSNCPIEHD